VLKEEEGKVDRRGGKRALGVRKNRMYSLGRSTDSGSSRKKRFEGGMWLQRG